MLINITRPLIKFFTRVDFGEREICNELSLVHAGEYQAFILHETTVYAENESDDSYRNCNRSS